MAWGTGCMHSQVVSRSPQEVIQIVQSLAPNAGPTGCKIEEKVAEQEWLIIIDEGIPGEKFKHYEISFRILAQETKGTEISIKAVEANLVDSLLERPPKCRVNSVARRYAKSLRLALETSEKQTGP